MTGPGLRLSVALAFFFLTVGSFLLSGRSGSVEQHSGACGDEAHPAVGRASQSWHLRSSAPGSIRPNLGQ